MKTEQNKSKQTLWDINDLIKSYHNHFFFPRPKQIAADADLACEQAHYYLTIKAQSGWNDLAVVSTTCPLCK